MGLFYFMKILIACEESQAVTKEFRALGHEAYSCDILPCSGGHPEWHIQDDVFSIHSDVNDQVEGTLEYPNSDNSYGSIEIIAISGEIVININKEVMQLLEPGQYFYALRLISSNFSENILKGKFEVQAFWMKNKLKIKYLKDNTVVVLRDLPKKIKVKKSKQYTVIVLTN